MDGPSVDRTAGFEMGVSFYRWGVAAALLGAMSGCSSGEPATGASAGRLSIQTAPLTLPGVTDACFGLKVYGHPTQWSAETLVWQEATLCASQFGDGDTSLTYVGTCDANGQDNTTELVLHDLYEGGDFGAGGTALSDYRNPCPSSEPCRLVRPCRENEDTAIEFNLVVLRSARQGFFDIAVEFEDIFCSAKVDCQSEGGGPLALLHDPKNPGSGRQPTVVVGFACTPGPVETPGEETWLYFDGPRIVCSTDGGVTQTTIPLGLDRASDGNVYGPADNPPAPILQVASYRGRELLTDTNGASLGKVYANAALALDFSRLAGLGECRLVGAMTASKNELPGLQTPADTAYPFIEIDVPLAGAGDTAYACTQHPLDDPNAPEGTGVFTQYTGFDSRYTFQYALSSSGPALGFEPGSNEISGRLYHDANRDGDHDPGETVYSGVTVLLQAAGGTATLATAVTDAEGIYRFDATSGQLFVNFALAHLAEAAYQIYVPNPAQLGAVIFAENPRPLTADQLGQAVDFPTLDALATVTVSAVRDTDGSVVAGARISVTGSLLVPGDTHPSARTYAAFTSPDGSVTFGLPPGYWTVRAYPHPSAIGGNPGLPNNATATASFDLGASTNQAHTVRYIGARSLSGEVAVKMGFTYVEGPFNAAPPALGPCTWRLSKLTDDDPNDTTRDWVDATDGVGSATACAFDPDAINPDAPDCAATTIKAGCYHVDLRCDGVDYGLPAGRWQRMAPTDGAADAGFCFQQGPQALPALVFTPPVKRAISLCTPGGTLPTVSPLGDVTVAYVNQQGGYANYTVRGEGQLAVRYDNPANTDPTTGVAPSHLVNITLSPSPGLVTICPDVCDPSDPASGGEQRGADGECSALCGNGTHDTDRAEQCDDAVDSSGSCVGCACMNGTVSDGAGSCTSCGNGVWESLSGEACDGGVNCQANCQCPPGSTPNGSGGCVVACGNGEMNLGEECEPGLHTGCTPACQCGPGYAPDPNLQPGCVQVCGNGTLDVGEQCDQGGLNGSGPCSASCTCLFGLISDGSGGCKAPARCGDGNLDSGESCDLGDDYNDGTQGCNTSCSCDAGWTPKGNGECELASDPCGNGSVDDGEDCDPADTDPNVINFNCTNTCQCRAGTYENPANYRGACYPLSVVASSFWLDGHGGAGSSYSGTTDFVSGEIFTTCPDDQPGCDRNKLLLVPVSDDGNGEYALDLTRSTVELSVLADGSDGTDFGITSDPLDTNLPADTNLAPGLYRVEPEYRTGVSGVAYFLDDSSLWTGTSVIELAAGTYKELGDVVMYPDPDERVGVTLCPRYPHTDTTTNTTTLNPATDARVGLVSEFAGPWQLDASHYSGFYTVDAQGCWNVQDVVAGATLFVYADWSHNNQVPAPTTGDGTVSATWSYASNKTAYGDCPDVSDPDTAYVELTVPSSGELTLVLTPVHPQCLVNFPAETLP